MTNPKLGSWFLVQRWTVLLCLAPAFICQHFCVHVPARSCACMSLQKSNGSRLQNKVGAPHIIDISEETYFLFFPFFDETSWTQYFLDMSKKNLPENWQCAVDLQDLVLETVSLQVPILFNSYNSILTQIFVLIRNLDINSPIHTDDSPPPLFFFFCCWDTGSLVSLSDKWQTIYAVVVSKYKNKPNKVL